MQPRSAASTEPHRRPALYLYRHLRWFAITLVTPHTYLCLCPLAGCTTTMFLRLNCLLRISIGKQTRLAPSPFVPARLGISINQSELSHPYYFQEPLLTAPGFEHISTILESSLQYPLESCGRTPFTSLNVRYLPCHMLNL
jgi:hypothetical protein